MKRIGPELKMPKLKGGEMKVPPFVSDLYYDLQDRRLLPLVALILVAIIATPILLAGGSDESEFAAPPPVAGATTASPAAREASLAVVEVNPGLREYRKRLKRRKPTDPFRQRFTGPVLKGAHLQSQSSSSTSTATSPTTVEGGSSGASEGGATAPPVTTVPSGGDSNGDGVPNGVSLYTYVLDLQITRIETKPDGKVEKTGPKLRKDVKAPSPLPGGKAPVVTYLGMGAKEPRRPMFLISPEVTAIYGEGTCVAGTGSCQLITLEKGFPVTFVYGANDVRYKINLVDVTPVPVKAPSS